MAWHILHGLLEQVRLQSTFPGKLWIVTMFIFRIVVVARIGEDVYHDEQSSFICNTLTPGCKNACFNRFSPISQLRYWSLMVLVVATPSILFFLYAMHEVYHAGLKYPSKESSKNNLNISSATQNLDSVPLRKRKKDMKSSSPLYVVTKIPKSPKTGGFGRFLRKRRHTSRDDEPFAKQSTSDNNETEVFSDGRRCQIYEDRRHIQFVKGTKRESSVQEREEMIERKFRSKMLQHPELARAYWWHVVFRTMTEVASILGQYYLYGFRVSELYECQKWPCPKTTDCFVSRPQEKTCLLWLMYGLGGVACLLSICEFWTLGLGKTANAFICCTDETYEEKRRRLAKLDVQHVHTPRPRGGSVSHGVRGHQMKPAISMESISSETTVESV